MARYREIYKNPVEEVLPPCESIQFLRERRLLLITVLKKVQREQEKLPQTHLRIGKSNGVVQYFEISEKEDNKGTYISKSQINKAQEIAQSQYNKKLIRLLSRQIKALDIFTKNFFEDEMTQLYKKLPLERRKLINPVTLSDKEFAKNWLTLSYDGLYFDSEESLLFTAKGERVRSKSELLIAEALSRRGIPYRYEYPILLEINGQEITVHPDFCCLNLRTRKEIFWEHFGLMDDSDYSQRVVVKLNTYTQNKIFLGHNLIATFESARYPLSSKVVEKIIDEYF